MSCLLCGSGIRQLTAEMVIHFSALKNLDKPGVWVFPKLLVCLDCGRSRLTVPKKELASARLTLANLAGPNTKGLNLNSRFVIEGLRGYLHRRFCWLPGPVDAQCWQATAGGLQTDRKITRVPGPDRPLTDNLCAFCHPCHTLQS